MVTDIERARARAARGASLGEGDDHLARGAALGVESQLQLLRRLCALVLHALCSNGHTMGS